MGLSKLRGVFLYVLAVLAAFGLVWFSATESCKATFAREAQESTQKAAEDALARVASGKAREAAVRASVQAADAVFQKGIRDVVEFEGAGGSGSAEWDRLFNSAIQSGNSTIEAAGSAGSMY